jgi:hypothetical protein
VVVVNSLLSAKARTPRRLTETKTRIFGLGRAPETRLMGWPPIVSKNDAPADGVGDSDLPIPRTERTTPKCGSAALFERGR